MSWLLIFTVLEGVAPGSSTAPTPKLAEIAIGMNDTAGWPTEAECRAGVSRVRSWTVRRELVGTYFLTVTCEQRGG